MLLSCDASGLPVRAALRLRWAAMTVSQETAAGSLELAVYTRADDEEGDRGGEFDADQQRALAD